MLCPMCWSISCGYRPAGSGGILAIHAFTSGHPGRAREVCSGYPTPRSPNLVTFAFAPLAGQRVSGEQTGAGSSLGCQAPSRQLPAAAPALPKCCLHLPAAPYSILVFLGASASPGSLRAGDTGLGCRLSPAAGGQNFVLLPSPPMMSGGFCGDAGAAAALTDPPSPRPPELQPTFQQGWEWKLRR